MADEQTYRAKAAELLAAAAASDNMKTRSQLLGQASYWSHLATEARRPTPPYPASDEDNGVRA